jgi:hypothetical protein
MISIDKRLSGDPLSWLCEPDRANPSIRYFTLRDLLSLLPVGNQRPRLCLAGAPPKR